MSNVVRLLESVGQNSQLRGANAEVLQSALQQADVDQALRLAIAACDIEMVRRLSGAPSEQCCFLAPGKEKDDERESPSRDDDEITSFVRTGTMA